MYQLQFYKTEMYQLQFFIKVVDVDDDNNYSCNQQLRGKHFWPSSKRGRPEAGPSALVPKEIYYGKFGANISKIQPHFLFADLDIQNQTNIFCPAWSDNAAVQISQRLDQKKAFVKTQNGRLPVQQNHDSRDFMLSRPILLSGYTNL